MFGEASNVDRNLFDYFLANDIIVKASHAGTYKFTDKGQYFNKLRMDEKLFNDDEREK